MPANRSHGRPPGRKPRPARIPPPHVIERREALARWRAWRRAHPGEGPGAPPAAQLALDVPDEDFVVIDSQRTVVAGPFDCISKAAQAWAEDSYGRFVRARDRDSDRTRLLTDRERAEADRVREASLEHVELDI